MFIDHKRQIKVNFIISLACKLPYGYNYQFSGHNNYMIMLLVAIFIKLV